MKLRLPFLLASALLSALATSHAANYTWSGSGNGGEWNNIANWNPSAIPGEEASDEDQILLENEKFGASSTLTLDSNRYLNSLSATLSGRKSMTIDGTGEMIFGGTDARLALNGEMTMSIDAIVRHNSDFTILSRGANVIFSKAFYSNSNNLTVDNDGGSKVVMNGRMYNVKDFVKTGAGTLVLGNSVTANTLTLKAGSLHFSGGYAPNASIYLGDASSRNTGVSLEAVNTYTTLGNVTWVNNYLNVTGEYSITLGSNRTIGPAVFTEDRTIHVDQKATLVLSQNFLMQGPGALKNTGSGTLVIYSGENTYDGLAITAGTVRVSPNATLGSVDDNRNPLGVGSVTVHNGSRLEMVGAGDFKVQGLFELDFGGIFEWSGAPGSMYIQTGGVLDGGTQLSTSGGKTHFFLSGDLHLEDGSLVNAPDLSFRREGNFANVYTIYDSGTSGTFGDLTVGTGVMGTSETHKLVLDSSVSGLEAKWVKLLNKVGMELQGDHQFAGTVKLELNSESTVNTGGYNATFSDLKWADTITGRKANIITLSSGTGSGGILEFLGANIQGGTGEIMFQGWMAGLDQIVFHYDISSESWFNNISFQGYDVNAGVTVLDLGGGKRELRPWEGTGNIFTWSSKAYKGSTTSSANNTEAWLAGNWDMNRIPGGAESTIIFADLDTNFTYKTIDFTFGGGEFVLGKLEVNTNLSERGFNLKGDDFRFDNGTERPEININFYSSDTVPSSSRLLYAYINNNIILDSKGMVFNLARGGVSLQGNVTGTGNMDIYGTYGVLAFNGRPGFLDNYSGNIIVHGGLFSVGANGIGSGKLIMEGGALQGGSHSGYYYDVSNELVINSDFAVSNLYLRFTATGNSSNDTIWLTADRKISPYPDRYIGGIELEQGRDLKGAGGLVLDRTYFTTWAGNSTFEGDLTLIGATGTGIFSIGSASVDGAITSDIIFGDIVANSSFIGQGNLNFSGYAKLAIYGSSGSVIDFRNNFQINSTPYYQSGSNYYGYIEVHGGSEIVKFTDLTVSGGLYFVIYGNKTVEIGDFKTLPYGGATGMYPSLNLTPSVYNKPDQSGDLLVKSMDGFNKTLTLYQLGASGGSKDGVYYGTTFDPTVDFKVSRFYTGTKVTLTKDDQILGQQPGQYATISISGILSNKGIKNRFSDVSVSTSTIELGTGGELTLGQIATWVNSNNTISFENTSGIWNTADDISLSTEHIWITNTNGWGVVNNFDRMAMISFTGYTKGAALYQHSPNLWELVSAGELACEWSGDGISNTSWSETSNWFAGRRPQAVGDIAIFRDKDENLHGKVIEVSGINTLSQLFFEGITAAEFSIGSEGTTGELRFVGKDAETAKISGPSQAIPTINAGLVVGGSGLEFTNVNLTITGVIRDDSPTDKANLILNSGQLTLKGNNTFTGDFTHKGGNLTMAHGEVLGTGKYIFEGNTGSLTVTHREGEKFLITNEVHLKGIYRGVYDELELKYTGPSNNKGIWFDNGIGYLYGTEQRLDLGYSGWTVFGENYVFADGEDGTSTAFNFASSSSSSTLNLYGQNTFSGGFGTYNSNSKNFTISIGASSILKDENDPSLGLASGPFGTGTISLAAYTMRPWDPVTENYNTPAHYTIHNTIQANNSTLTLSGKGSLTLDSHVGINITNKLTLQVSSNDLVLLVKSKINASSGDLLIQNGSYKNWVRLFNADSVIRSTTIASNGMLSLANDNVLGTGKVRLVKGSFIQAYGDENLSERVLNNLFDFETWNASQYIQFSCLSQQGGDLSGGTVSRPVVLRLNGEGASNLDCTSSGYQTSFYVSGGNESTPFVVSFGEKHNLVNGGISVRGSSPYGGLELLGTKEFAGFTGTPGNELLGSGYDDYNKYALFAWGGVVSTTLTDKDMVIGAKADADRITPFGQGEIYLGGGTMLVRTNNRNVYLEDALFEAQSGVFRVTGGGDLILGRKGDGSNFDQKIAGQYGNDGTGRLKAEEGSRILIDAGHRTVELRSHLEGNVTLKSGTLSLNRTDALNYTAYNYIGTVNLEFDGGTLALNQKNQTMARGSTLSLSANSKSSTLDFGGLPSVGNVLFNAWDMGDFTSGKLNITGWTGSIAGQGRSQFILKGYSTPEVTYYGNIHFEGYAPGAKVVKFGVGSGIYYEIVPYGETYVWIGSQSSDWGVSTNWQDRDIPNEINASVTFNDDTVNPEAMVYDATRTIGSLTFHGTQGQDFSVVPSSAGGGKYLTMEQTPGSGIDASINLNGNSNVHVSIDLYLLSNLLLATDSGTTLTISGDIYNEANEPKDVIKTGEGTLIVSGKSGFTGAFRMVEGTLQIAADEEVIGTVASSPLGKGDLVLQGGTIKTSGADRTSSNRIVLEDGFTLDSGTTWTWAHKTVDDSESMIATDTTLNITSGSKLIVTADNTFDSDGKITKTGGGELEWNSVLDGRHTDGIVLRDGTLTLNADNNYTGGTQMAGGVLAMGHNNALGAAGSMVLVTENSTLRSETDLDGVGQNIALSTGKTLTIQTSDKDSASTDLTLTGVVSGNAALVKTGAGTLTLTNHNTLQGLTTINQGTLQIGNGTSTGTMAGNIALSGGSTHLVFNQNGNSSYNGVISGSGDLAKKGTGVLTLSGTNTFTGGTSLEAGALTLANNRALGTGDLAMANGTILNYTDGLAVANKIAVTGTASLAIAGGSATQSGIISGDHLSKDGAGTLILTAANTYTGATVVNGGTLQIGNGGDGSIAALTDTSKTIEVKTGAALAFNLGNGSSQELVYAGSISGAGQVIQRGDRTIVFTEIQTYTGGTIIENGTLKVKNGGGIGLSYDGTVEIQEGGTFYLGDTGNHYGLSYLLKGDGVLKVDISENMNNASSEYAPDTFTFSNTNDSAAITLGRDFHGTVEMHNAAYTIDARTANFLNSGGATLMTRAGSVGQLRNISHSDPSLRTIKLAGTVDFAGGSMTWNFDSSNNAEAYLSAGAIKISEKTTFNLKLKNTLDVGSTSNLDASSLFGGTVTGSDTLLLGKSDTAIQGAHNWSDLKIYVNGWLQANSAVRQGMGINATEVAKGVFDWTTYSQSAGAVEELRVGYKLVRAEIYKDQTLQIVLTDTAITNEFGIELTDYSQASATADELQLGEASSLTQPRIGAGNVFFSDKTTGKDGIRLNSANSYTGTTTIDGNTTLVLGGSGGFGSGASHTSRLIVNQAGAHVQLSGNTAHTGSVLIGTGGKISLGTTGTGVINIHDNGGSISGTAALAGKGSIVLGGGTLTISDNNDALEAAASVAAGATLVLDHINALGKGSTAGNITVNGTLATTAAGTLDNLIAGGAAGVWDKQGIGKLTSARDNTFAGSILVSNGTLSLTGSNTSLKGTELAGGSILELGRSDSAGSSLINLTGATGTIRALNDITLSNAVAIATAGTIDTNGKTVESNGLISGAGALSLQGGGTLTILGNNTYSGATTISGGTTVILEANTPDGLSSGNVSLAGGSTLELAFANGTFDNILSGAVTETVLVSGTGINLSAANDSFLGTWDITGSANISGTAAGVVSNVGAGSTVHLDGGSLNLATTDAADFTFANKMYGEGTLSVTMGGADSVFSFDTSAVKAGGAFTGILEMKKGAYQFSTADKSGTGVLAGGTLKLTGGGGSTGYAVLDDNYQIGGLDLNGGTLKVTSDSSGSPSGLLTVGDLNVAGGGTIAVDIPDSIGQEGAHGSLFDDDGGDGVQQKQLVSATGIVGGNGSQLQLTNYDGSQVGDPSINKTIQLEDNGGTEIAEAYYGYTISVKGGSNDPDNGIYLGYGMNRINSYTADTQYELANTQSSDNTMGAQLTSTAKGASANAASVGGGFTFKALGDSATERIIIANAANNYTGKTLVSQGTVQYGANNAFGKSSELELASGTTVDMAGNTQVGDNALGKLTMTAGNTTLEMKGGLLDITGNATLEEEAVLNMGGGVLNVGGNASFMDSTTVTMSAGDINITGNAEISDSSIAFGNGSMQIGGTAVIGSASELNIANGSLSVSGAVTMDGLSSLTLGASGRLVLSGGGSIEGAGSLVGGGSIDIAGTNKVLSISGANTGLSAVTDIRTTNKVVLDSYSGLGSGQINLAGTLEVKNAADGILVNNLSSSQGVIILDNSDGEIRGNISSTGTTVNLVNSEIDFTGTNGFIDGDTINIDGDSSAKVHGADNLGDASVNIGGTFILDYADTDDDWELGNALNNNGTDYGLLVKDGAGKIIIDRINNRDGATSVNNGELYLKNTGALGTGDITVSSGAILALDALAAGEFTNDMAVNGVVNIASSTLELSGDITGGGSINLLEDSVVSITGDNSGFSTGASWNIEDGAKAEITLTDNLGTTADVFLDGELTIDRETTPVAGGYTWENTLDGSGRLIVNLSSDDDEFVFGATHATGRGTDFTGTLELGTGTFRLGGDSSANTQSLASATLVSLDGNRTIIGNGSGANNLGGLKLDGGVLDFLSSRIAGEKMGIVDDHITLVDSEGTLNIQGGTVAVDAGLLDGIDTTADTTASLLTQDDGKMGVKLIETEAGKTIGGTADLKVIDSATGNEITLGDYDHEFDIVDASGKTATGYYNFGTDLGTDRDGLYISYKLVEVNIEEDKTLVLDNKNATGSSADFSALISGKGNLLVDATGTDNKVISLSYSGGRPDSNVNSFTGWTRVTGGTTLQAAVDNVISHSSQLVLETDSLFDLNDTDQTVHHLTGDGEINFNGTGILTAVNLSHNDTVFTGDLLGGGQMVKTGAGTLTLDGGQVEHSLGTIVEEGTLNMTGTMAHAVSPLVTIKGDGVVNIDGGSIGSSGNVLFVAEDANGAITVKNITAYTVGRDGQKLIDASGTGEMDFIFDNVKELKGDVYAGTDALVNMVLKNNTSYTGKIDPVSLDVDGTSVWNLTADSSLTKLNNSGLVNFETSSDGSFKELVISGDLRNTSDTPGTFAMNVSLAEKKADLITVGGDLSGVFDILIKRDSMADITDDLIFSILLVDVNGENTGSANGETMFTGSTDFRMKTARVQAGDAYGEHMEDWFLVYDHRKEELGNTGRGVLGISEITLMWFAQQDSLVKRMGELRMNQPLSDNWVDNAWVRTYGGEYNVNSKVIGTRYEDMIWGSDLGVDKGWQIDRKNRVYTGGFAGYGWDKKQFKAGGSKGESDSFYFGGYGTLINDCGCYADLVVKAQHFDNEFTAFDGMGTNTTGSYKQWALGASLEVGRMIGLGGNWYIEPQAQVSYMHSQGAGYNTIGANSFRADVGSMDVLNIRYGVSLKKTYMLENNGMLQPYVLLEGINQTSRGGHVRTEDGQWRPNMDGASVRMGTGIIWQIDGKNQVHCTYDASFGEKYNMPWNINLGYRYQF